MTLNDKLVYKFQLECFSHQNTSIIIGYRTRALFKMEINKTIKLIYQMIRFIENRILLVNFDYFCYYYYNFFFFLKVSKRIFFYFGRKDYFMHKQHSLPASNPGSNRQHLLNQRKFELKYPKYLMQHVALEVWKHVSSMIYKKSIIS